MLMQHRIMHPVAHIRELVSRIVHAMHQLVHHLMQRVVMWLRWMSRGVGHRSASRAVPVNAYVVFPPQHLWLVDFASHKENCDVISG
jgi:hypothetical protein